MRRGLRLFLGVVSVLVGLFAAVGGLAIVLLVGPDGSVGIPPTRLLSTGYAVTLPQLNVPRLPGGQRVIFDVALQRSDTPMFIGIGPSSAVDAYLHGVPIDVIEQIDWPGAARTTTVDGATRPEPPATQGFWTITARGAEPSIHWDATPGDWTLVVMAANAARSVDVTATGSATLGVLGPIGFIALAVALAILAVGVWTTVRAARAS